MVEAPRRVEQPLPPLILSLAIDRNTGAWSTSNSGLQERQLEDVRLMISAVQQVAASLQEARVAAEVAAAKKEAEREQPA